MSLVLRQAHAADIDAFYRLKSDPDNVYWSGHQGSPDPDKLKIWFRDHCAVNDDRRIYVCEVDGSIVGYAYADFVETGIKTSIGVLASETQRGLGRRILQELCSTLHQEFHPDRIEAWILPENIASVKAHEAAGYRSAPDCGSRHCPSPPPDGTQGLLYCWIWRAVDVS